MVKPTTKNVNHNEKVKKIGWFIQPMITDTTSGWLKTMKVILSHNINCFYFSCLRSAVCGCKMNLQQIPTQINYTKHISSETPCNVWLLHSN